MLFIVFPDVKVVRFKVDLDIKIDRILDYIGHQYKLIHNGTFLLPLFSVEFYNLGNGDRLWAVLKNDTVAINRYMNQDCSLNYAIYLLNRHRKEVADEELEETKRNDLRATKIMSKTKRFRKLLKRYNEMEDLNYCKPLPIFETKYVKPDKPCSDPIPPFWK